MLFEVCSHMLHYLCENDTNATVVHCNAGKGRTGTAISSFLIFSGIADNFLEAMIFYGWKRFSNGRGVT